MSTAGKALGFATELAKLAGQLLRPGPYKSRRQVWAEFRAKLHLKREAERRRRENQRKRRSSGKRRGDGAGR